MIAIAECGSSRMQVVGGIVCSTWSGVLGDTFSVLVATTVLYWLRSDRQRLFLFHNLS